MTSSWRHRLFTTMTKTSQRPGWKELVGENWTETIMAVKPTSDFQAKQGRSTGRWLVEKDGKSLSVYLKRHYQLPWWRGLLAWIWPDEKWSPAIQEWHHLQWARDQEFLVPPEVAVVEYIGPFCKLQSCLVIEELVGMLPLHQAIPKARKSMETVVFQSWKNELITELARICRELHQRNHFHKDLYLCHFYLPSGEIEHWNGNSLNQKVFMIDLHRLGHHPWSRLWWQVKDLAQLLFSSDLDEITKRDRLRFWWLYRGKTLRTTTTRWLEWFIRIKFWRYKDHNQKKQKKASSTAIGQERKAA